MNRRVGTSVSGSYYAEMNSIPSILANLEMNPDDEHWIELAHVVMLQLAERYRPPVEPFNRLVYERDMEVLDRLTDMIREYRERQCEQSAVRLG